ncbi:hypothetical protein D3C84_1134490 [compost metagenome]
MKNGQYRTVTPGVEEFVGVPARRQRAGFSLTVADDTGHDQVRVVERRAIGMGQGITQLPTFMDGAGNLRRDMAG